MAKGPFGLEATLTGVTEAVAALTAIGKKAKAVLRSAVGKGAAVVRKAAKGLVVRKSGLLAKSIASSVSIKKDGSSATARVGPRRGLKRVVTRDGRAVLSDPVRYAHLVEKGTTHSQALPFLAPAWATSKAQAEQAIIDRIMAGIAKTGG